MISMVDLVKAGRSMQTAGMRCASCQGRMTTGDVVSLLRKLADAMESIEVEETARDFNERYEQRKAAR